MIDSADISVVVQGPVRPETAECLRSIRRWLAKSEIIFSTWIGEKTEDLIYDKLITTEIPPAYKQDLSGNFINNLNRMIRSTKAGVEVAQRKHLLKIRSDLILDNVNFINTFENYPASGPRSVFSRKIVVPLFYSRTSFKGYPTPFHISDWAAFGKTEDIRKYYLGTQEVEEPFFSQYFIGCENKTPYNPTLFMMAPEQYLCLSCFRRFFSDIDMIDCSEVSARVMSASDEFIVSNFIISSYSETGWRLPKYEISVSIPGCAQTYFQFWTKYVYERKYQQYCDNDYKVTDKRGQNFIKYPLTCKNIQRLYKHVRYLLNRGSLLNRLEQVLAIHLLFILTVLSILYEVLRSMFRHSD